ncbi:hypothetical protein L1887_15847 [Cichorium endivia]|nr:hypothetical protein L1887_15847 [Cichorium endivia]
MNIKKIGETYWTIEDWEEAIRLGGWYTPSALHGIKSGAAIRLMEIKELTKVEGIFRKQRTYEFRGSEVFHSFKNLIGIISSTPRILQASINTPRLLQTSVNTKKSRGAQDERLESEVCIFVT